MGCRVIMVNRKEDQGEEAIKAIKEEVGEQAQIEWKQCDLGNLGMVKQVFSELAQSLDRLDQVGPFPRQIRHRPGPEMLMYSSSSRLESTAISSVWTTMASTATLA
jgi:hypothetical protein